MKRMVLTSCFSFVLLTTLCHAEESNDIDAQISISQQEEEKNFILFFIASQWPSLSEPDKQQTIQEIQQQFPDITRTEIDSITKILTLKKQLKYRLAQLLEDTIKKELSIEQQAKLALEKNTVLEKAQLDQKIKIRQKIEEQIKNEWNRYNGDPSRQGQHRVHLMNQFTKATAQVQRAARYIRHKTQELNTCAMRDVPIIIQDFAQDEFPNPVDQEVR